MLKQIIRLGYFITMLLPWRIRRLILQKFYGYQIAPTATIGFSWIRPTHLVMEENTYIGHFTVCTGLALLELKAGSKIGNSNRIFGPRLGSTSFYGHRDRYPALRVGTYAEITHSHLLDCTDTIAIGSGTIVAGYGTQLLTHSLDLRKSRQDCQPITIGRCCFIGTSSVLLKGVNFPDRSVLAAGSVLIKNLICESGVYSGVPASQINDGEGYAAWFNRIASAGE